MAPRVKTLLQSFISFKCHSINQSNRTGRIFNLTQSDNFSSFTFNNTSRNRTDIIYSADADADAVGYIMMMMSDEAGLFARIDPLLNASPRNGL